MRTYNIVPHHKSSVAYFRLWNKRSKNFQITILILFSSIYVPRHCGHFFIFFKNFQQLISVALCLFRSLEYLKSYIVYQIGPLSSKHFYSGIEWTGRSMGTKKLYNTKKVPYHTKKSSRIQIRNFYLLIPYSRGEHIKCVPKSRVK